MRRVPIRLKLAAALAVPLLALFLRTSLEIVDESRHVADLENQARLARMAVGPGGLINRMQDERTWTVIDGSGADGPDLALNAPVEDYAEARRLTDEALADLRAEVAKDSRVEAIFAPALDGFDALAGIRADVDANRATPERGTSGNTTYTEGIFQRYVALVRPIFDATDKVIVSIGDARLRRGAELVNIASRNIQQYSDLSRHILIDAFTEGGVNERSEIRAAAVRKSQWDAYTGQLLAADPPYDAVVTEHFPRDFVAAFSDLADRSLRGETLDPMLEIAPTMQITDWGGLKAFRDALSAEVTRTADEIAGDARERQRSLIAVAVLTLVAALLLTYLVSRSITRPLRSLTAQATAMASTRLPAALRDVLQTPLGDDVTVPSIEPVRVRTRDEVLDVADALNIVQDTALELAVEQAVLRRNIADSFVNLGRRNQNLLVRQLDLITQLENAEVDSDSLANLFRLDHLATRMRRNAESLLVLAGIEPPRQWARPVSVSDVVRAALGEVEDYQLVAVRDVQPAMILGSAAADLAHLMAELIENALVFSPVDRSVEVRGQAHAQGFYTLAVIDHGGGMMPDAIDASNRRLGGNESFTVAPSKYLGHYVAGNLAARHGIAVRLVPSAGSGGITATIDLPASLLIQQDRLTSGPPRAATLGAPAGASAGGARPEPMPQPVAAAAVAAPGRVPGAPARPSWWEATAPPAPADGGAYRDGRAN
jgi:signal transduction histidine kinase